MLGLIKSWARIVRRYGNLTCGWGIGGMMSGGTVARAEHGTVVVKSKSYRNDHNRLRVFIGESGCVQPVDDTWATVGLLR